MGKAKFLPWEVFTFHCHGKFTFRYMAIVLLHTWRIFSNLSWQFLKKKLAMENLLCRSWQVCVYTWSIYFTDPGKLLYIHGIFHFSLFMDFFLLHHGKIYFMKHGNLPVNDSWYTFFVCFYILAIVNPHIFCHHAHNAKLL